MEPGLLRDSLTLLAGVASGVLSAAFGVGGAVISTPAIRALGVSPLLAIGTTLPSILPSAISGTTRYLRERLILWRVVAITCPAGVLAAIAGSKLSHHVPGEGHLLMVLTALLLAYTALRMARPSPPEPDPPAEGGEPVVDATPLVLGAVGILAGLLSGLLGVGGGVVMVPAFAELAKIPMKAAVATSLVCVAIFAVPSTVAHSLQGDIDWRVALLLTAGVVPGARLGAAAALRVSDARLRRAVAIFLGVVAAVYLAGEAASLVSA